jgi:hypothetical protein
LADIGQVEAALAALGDNADWHKVGLATHSATSGSEEGWAALNRVHPTAREAWDALRPMRVTAGTLFYLADEAQPGWRDDYDATLEAELSGASEASHEELFGSHDTAPAQAKPEPETTDAGARSLGSANGKDKDSGTVRRLIKTSEEFVASLKPPDYLIKGVLQRRFLYSMTAPTGAGKTCIAMRVAAHVAFGLPLLGRPVKQGNVLFLAGENPTTSRCAGSSSQRIWVAT